jgi:hypothetical protein
MPRGRKTSLTLTLTPEERQVLTTWQRQHLIPVGLARRGRVMLLVEGGMPLTHVAARVGFSRRCVAKWVRRFLAHGLDGLRERPRGRRGDARMGREEGA